MFSLVMLTTRPVKYSQAPTSSMLAETSPERILSQRQNSKSERKMRRENKRPKAW